MKTKAIAVIGANYGDEGKGATTNYLTRKYNVKTVVRFNGGNQAGHTVQLISGGRHIFSSYGSGTLNHAKTYISDLALFNPKAANEERGALEKLISTPPPPLSVHPDTHLITPWDIALNQFLERGRGDGRHGSCGMGIGETMNRVLTKEAPKFQMKNLADPKEMYLFISDIRQWFKKRVKEEAEKGSFTYLTPDQVINMQNLVTVPTPLISELWTYLQASMNCNVQMQDLDITLSGARYVNPDEEDEHEVLTRTSVELTRESVVIFEGAQGLLLDEDDPDHQPYVTWSKTGLQNVVRECIKYNLDLTEVYYVTRPYLTRHGQGPILVGEETKEGWGSDLTNRPNDYQGSLRFAHQNWSNLRKRIEKDLLQLKGFKPTIKIALTCLDQVDGEEDFRFDSEHGSIRISTPNLISAIQAQLGFDLIVINGLKG